MRKWITIIFWSLNVAAVAIGFFVVVSVPLITFEVCLTAFYYAYRLKIYLDEPQYIKDEKRKLKAEEDQKVA